MQCDCESAHCDAHKAGGCLNDPTTKFKCYGLVENLCNYCLGIARATVPASKIQWAKPLAGLMHVAVWLDPYGPIAVVGVYETHAEAVERCVKYAQEHGEQEVQRDEMHVAYLGFGDWNLWKELA